MPNPISGPVPSPGPVPNPIPGPGSNPFPVNCIVCFFKKAYFFFSLLQPLLLVNLVLKCVEFFQIFLPLSNRSVQSPTTDANIVQLHLFVLLAILVCL